ncbi:MAG: beta-ketoacyl-[acyl-carrier-protein] synthase family protein [Sedimentisphaerales bacterium]|nr:beta-ketoacyl-[acyl-carrier-protein] synthase family protein [Sedimentisphaerales bacterium]
MDPRRVVITGVGVVSPLGVGKESFIEGFLSDRSGIDRIRGFDPVGLPCQVGGEVEEFKINEYVPKIYRKATKLMSRDIVLAVVAAELAIRDAGLKTKGTAPDEIANIDPRRSGVNIGAGLICCDLDELGIALEHAQHEGKFSYAKWGREGMESLTPLWLLKYLPNMQGCHISIIHDLQGPSNSITCAEASGLLAIGEAYRTIVRDKADMMVAGGAECKINPMGLLRQCLLGRVATRYNDRPDQACRPFDRQADGCVMAEGGGIVILEERQRARRRGARIYGEITGFGASNNFSGDFIRPDDGAAGVVIALQKALDEAQLTGDEIRLLIPHGSAIAEHDRAEAQAIRSVFGPAAAALPVVATKSRIGNSGAGASALDLVAAVLSLQEDVIPANRNCPEPPPEYGLNLPDTTIRSAGIRNAMCCCYTYGGQTAAAVVQRPDSR